jgi:hypothetical protein
MCVCITFFQLLDTTTATTNLSYFPHYNKNNVGQVFDLSIYLIDDVVYPNNNVLGEN